MHGVGTDIRDFSEGAGWGAADNEIRTFRLGDVGLVDLVDPSLVPDELLRVLLWEWASSPSGVLIRLDTAGPVADGTVRTVAGLGSLFRTWRGTPIGLITHSRALREHVAKDPHGRHLVIGTTFTETWERMWSRGGTAHITIELPPTVRAPRTARDVVVRACLDWNLSTLAGRAALLTGDLVTRSVSQGAHDIHFTVSRHHSQIRVLARDDVPSGTADVTHTIDDVLATQFTRPALSGHADSLGEVGLDGHHVRWAVVRDAPPARQSPRRGRSRETAGQGRPARH
jgi:hypothetical protein